MTSMNPFNTSAKQGVLAWKDAINSWTKHSIESLWPEIFQKINWSQPIESLKWKLPKASQEKGETSEVDLIYQVSSSDASNPRLWIHITSKPENPEVFAQRLFQRSYQLYTYYQAPIMPLAFMINTRNGWQVTPHKTKAFGYLTHHFEFKAAVLEGYLGHEQKMLSSPNPFETLIGLYLTIQKKATAPESSYSLKLELHQHLINHAKNKETFVKLYSFLDRWLPLDPAFDERYHESVYEWERKKNIDYLIHSQQFGIEHWVKKGRLSGMEEANRQHLRRMLSIGLERKVMQEILGIDNKELNRLLVLEHDETMDTVIKTDL